MKTFLIILGGILLLILLVVVLAIVLTPWMNRWHTTDQERAADFPGDDLVKDPKLVINRGVTINTTPARIYPWLLQIGADKAGMYSYTWLERLTGCRMAKDEVIRAQWQGLKEGDLMKMCAGEFAPPPYIVARLIPEKALIFGHKDGEQWAETWQFMLIPQEDGSTRLLTRTSTTMVGGAWEVFNRIAFVMERKMLLTIKSLAETGSR
ncbi:MAG TPA: hypothetical protein PKK59_11485 [Anaerolineaceae bacterium]|nr:hypothetical protein [Anaerolineaceae bacterium]